VAPIPRPTVLIVAALSLLSAPVGARRDAPTAREIVERIKQHVGVPWSEQTVDTFKDGDPDTRVTGIATTMMATMDVLTRSAAAGRNLIITHEPTFYDHLDPTEPLDAEHDAVQAAKRAFIKAHGLVVWRFHDHWHRRRPDGIQAGMVRALGWESYARPEDESLFQMPEITLERLAGFLKSRLGIRTMRVVGDPAMKVTKIALLPGASGFPAHRHALQQDVDVLVIGEAREWETVPYVDDAVAEGRHKALVILGHIPSEQAGMDECARWLKTFVTDVPVEFVPAREPFWAPR
jgi:putative NIF3 family GTP cyclohydrolase 1 type 2